MKAPDPSEVMIFANQTAFRDWLLAHHATDREVWIGRYKKGVPKVAMTYPQAVDEALCFGWIDGIAYRIDDEVFAIRFTPRAKRSNWSLANVKRVAELRAEGRMQPAGIAAFEHRTEPRTGVYSYENRPADLPEDYLRRLRADEAAWRYWQAQTASYRRAATWWVVSAIQEATRERRLETLIADSARGRVTKPFAYGRQNPGPPQEG